MDQINAVVKIKPNRLYLPLAPWGARVGGSFVVQFVGVPDDCTNVKVRVAKNVSGSLYADAPCREHADGVRVAYCDGSFFPASGQFKYQVLAKDYKGNDTRLGDGIITVEA